MSHKILTIGKVLVKHVIKGAIAEGFVSTSPEPLQTPVAPIPATNTQPVARPAVVRQQPQKKGTSCIPCATNHLSTCSGLLSEALRFARSDGLNSTDVIERLGLCQDEINAMERIDLRAEKVNSLDQGEKGIADYTLKETRKLRHQLEHMKDVSDLETLTAGMQQLRTNIGKQWFENKLPSITKEEGDIHAPVKS